ncbi:hypothetical protein Tco_0188033 [Tanacetum coccineum]
MSSPSHPTSDIEDAFSSNFLDYIPTSLDYVPASLGKTYSSSSNNSFGVVPIVIIQQDFDNLEAELQKAHARIAKLQRKQMGNNNKFVWLASGLLI